MRRAILWLALGLMFAAPGLAQTPVNITFGWDKSSDDTRDPASTHPVTYRLYVSPTAPVGGVMPETAGKHEAGTALELMVSMSAGTYYVAASAFWCAVHDGTQCQGTAMVESGLSNVLRLIVQVPPGNPSNYRVRITGMP